jgi:LuxR family maltose regulon positive regulatory protein
MTYEALICLRSGDSESAERIMRELADSEGNNLLKLVKAEFCLKKEQYAEAEALLNEFILAHPHGIAFEPILVVRIPLALALFGQHKVNQAVQVISEAIRLAAPERFIRPFLDGGSACVPLLWLLWNSQELNADSLAFTKELLHLLDPGGQHAQISKVELENLTTSATISAREQDVLKLLSAGCSNREIASELSVSESTVKTHLSNIYCKLNATSRFQAIARARELSLVA